MKTTPTSKPVGGMLQVETGKMYTKAINRFVENIKHGNHIEKIVLFGSVGRGSARVGSDVDILVIGKDAKRIRKSVIGAASKILFEEGIIVECIVVNRQEYEQNKKYNPAFYEETNKGRILYERAPAS